MTPHDPRPDPDALLARVNEDERRAARGRLKIFFGASAGVGKTYAMLEAARRKRAEGVDVVVGYVEPHGRDETERLAADLPSLPPLAVHYRNTLRHELDLDAALARRPAVLVVDELAHSNVVDGTPAPRHAKRWQDIDELLAAGIDVWTTVNVQHLESLNDVVAGITGARQQETVPDRVFDEADEVELIDLPADDLLARLAAGKVYVREHAAHAREHFFRKGNLIALRELALRRTADRVDAAMRDYRDARGISSGWAARERLVACIGPTAAAEQVVRAAKRLADALDAEWIVVYVETPALLRLPDAERNRRIDVLRLAESLGAETVTLGGASVADEVLQYARTRNATRIVVGRASRSGWRAWVAPSPIAALLREKTDIDVVVVGSDALSLARRSPLVARTEAMLATGTSGKRRWPAYALAVAITALATGIAWLLSTRFAQANLVMVYLLGCTVVAVRLGRGPSVLASLLGVAAFDFFFVPPQYTFAVADAQYLLTFAIMLAVSLTIANLTAGVRLQARVAGHRERRTALLYAMSRELAQAGDREAMARTAVRHVGESFDGQAVVLLPDDAGRLHLPHGRPEPHSLRGADLGVAQWVLDHDERAGLGSDTLPGQEALYAPLPTPQGPLGVIALLPANPRRVLLPEQRQLFAAFAAQIALALDRVRLAERARGAEVNAAAETVRNALLAGISHDLRTPLAVIAGSASALAEQGDDIPAARRRELAASIYTQAEHVTTLVGNVLELARLEAGNIAPRTEAYPLDDIVGAVLHRLDPVLGGLAVTVALPPDLPPVDVDATLVEQALANLVDNARKHAAGATTLAIAASRRGDHVELTVSDDGAGLPPGDPERLFAKFERGRAEDAVGGAGLGLALVRAIADAHGGSVRAERVSPHGARFVLALLVARGSA
ncbi:MAG: sensor histidine kinase KdpD [Proteobacteria bacterium]|nr:sensor histidine kinase KdpD [Pseudomonadota bacterium]